MTDGLEKGVNKAKVAVFDTLEDSKVAAERLIKHGRYAVEDGVEEAVRAVKRNPVGAVAIAFAAGAAFGLLMPRLVKRA